MIILMGNVRHVGHFYGIIESGRRSKAPRCITALHHIPMHAMDTTHHCRESDRLDPEQGQEKNHKNKKVDK
jgi:hypothetical protein